MKIHIQMEVPIPKVILNLHLISLLCQAKMKEKGRKENDIRKNLRVVVIEENIAEVEADHLKEDIVKIERKEREGEEVIVVAEVVVMWVVVVRVKRSMPMKRVVM